jgi:hypothetical protein
MINLSVALQRHRLLSDVNDVLAPQRCLDVLAPCDAAQQPALTSIDRSVRERARCGRNSEIDAISEGKRNRKQDEHMRSAHLALNAPTNKCLAESNKSRPANDVIRSSSANVSLDGLAQVRTVS